MSNPNHHTPKYSSFLTWVLGGNQLQVGNLGFSVVLRLLEWKFNIQKTTLIAYMCGFVCGNAEARVRLIIFFWPKKEGERGITIIIIIFVSLMEFTGLSRTVLFEATNGCEQHIILWYKRARRGIFFLKTYIKEKLSGGVGSKS